MSGRIWIIAAVGAIVVIAVFAAWYFLTSRPGQIQPGSPVGKTEQELRRMYEQRLKPSPLPGQYQPPSPSP